MAVILGLAIASIPLLPAGDALAGCGDGACARVDWTEATDTLPNGDVVSLKIHGGFAWEASPDGWATHPLGGSLDGYLWLSCPQAGGVVDSVCLAQLKKAEGLRGTQTPFVFGGDFYDVSAGHSIQPSPLFAEGADGKAQMYTSVNLGQPPINNQICPTAFALPIDAPPDGGATGAGGGSTTATSATTTTTASTTSSSSSTTTVASSSSSSTSVVSSSSGDASTSSSASGVGGGETSGGGSSACAVQSAPGAAGLPALVAIAALAARGVRRGRRGARRG